MTTRTPEEIAVRSWVESASGVTTIYQNQKGPRPIPLPYASVLQLTDAMVGGEFVREYRADGVDAIERVSGRRQGTFQVDVYGDNHTAIARNVLLSIDDEEVIRANEAAGLTVAYAATEPTRLSRDSDGVTEDRTMAEYAVRFVIERERDTTELIEHLETTTNYSG